MSAEATTSTSIPPSTSQHTLNLDSVPVQSPPPPEIESTLSRLSAYRNVRGVMVLSRSSLASTSTTPSSSASASNASSTSTVHAASTVGSGVGLMPNGIDSNLDHTSVGGIIQTTGTIFEGESGAKYAKAVEAIVGGVSKALNDCEAGDELRFMRIRTKKHELIITPDERYLLVVLQDPGQ
ncbi:uncharacterized protein I303_106525 [Kwoniella dejecticola CBS 10117]|uniref:Dynein light chain roadblock-type n=1 Tax=Kwoniella dejecticola CBS 10117 TaxID=1296121 RepID=A0A1A5ZUG4_9TREE|nr:dynein light chain roadblock-type [Kwoniella dejecticola CBS 10117]OBR81447.1 dynein light chain roadblock-type [Kwoniella dejecticola CBS 10117]